MNYEQMSDFEINRSVEKLTGMYCEDANGKYIPTCNYCNNPADAWPIIAANKINIDFQYGSWPTAEYDEYIYTDKNPLRAAMIVFLMMKEHKELDK